MKYNLRTLKGKRIVGGDPNLATKNEIHVTKIPEELGISNESSNTGPKYYLSKDKLPMITYQTSDIFEYLGYYLWQCAYVIRGKSNNIFGGRGCVPMSGIITGSIEGGDHMDGIMIDLNLSGICYLEGANVRFSYDSISEFIYEMLLLGHVISDNTTITKEFIDDYINSILVEVTKEQFFDFNYTLIKD